MRNVYFDIINLFQAYHFSGPKLCFISPFAEQFCTFTWKTVISERLTMLRFQPMHSWLLLKYRQATYCYLTPSISIANYVFQTLWCRKLNCSPMHQFEIKSCDLTVVKSKLAKIVFFGYCVGNLETLPLKEIMLDVFLL